MKYAHALAQVQPMPVAFLVPGIGIPYSKAVEQLRGCARFEENCGRAGIESFKDATVDFLRDYKRFLIDNLENQKLSYVVNCTMCDIYRNSCVEPQVVVGYSMGIYSALYAAGYYSFETGVLIVEKAYDLVEQLCSSSTKSYGMGLILGLTEKDIRSLIFKEAQGIDIAVTNGKRNFVVAGERDKVDLCLDRAVEAGAMGARRILTQHPYHSAFLKDIRMEFLKFLGSMPFSSPRSMVLSPIDGRVIHKEEAAMEIVRALYTPLRFDVVMGVLTNNHGIFVCYETGPAQSMKKLVRYINKKVRVRVFGEQVLGEEAVE